MSTESLVIAVCPGCSLVLPEGVNSTDVIGKREFTIEVHFKSPLLRLPFNIDSALSSTFYEWRWVDPWYGTGIARVEFSLKNSIQNPWAFLSWIADILNKNIQVSKQC